MLDSSSQETWLLEANVRANRRAVDWSSAHEDLMEFRRTIALESTDERWRTFRRGAAAFAKLVNEGWLKVTEYSDEMLDIASAHGFLEIHGIDAVQGVLDEAIRQGTIFADAPSAAPEIERSNNQLDARAGQQTSTIPVPHVAAIDLPTFLQMDITPRATILTPWLLAQGLAMIYAPRGTGKTRVAHGIAYAIATGSGFLKWTAPQAKRVLLIDGEMPTAALQEMLQATVSASQCSLADPSYFKIAAADLVRDGLPDLADPTAQLFYSAVIADADLVIIDNLSTLCRRLRENDADTWTPVQSWVLSLRRAGKSVLLIHHGGKSGAQRGTSRKEDVLDTVISLRRPPDYSAEQGARFEVHFEKSRGFHGPDAEPFETRLIGDQWTVNPIKSGDDLDTLKALRKQGMSVRDIADRTGLSKSSVQRRLEGDDE